MMSASKARATTHRLIDPEGPFVCLHLSSEEKKGAAKVHREQRLTSRIW